METQNQTSGTAAGQETAAVNTAASAVTAGNDTAGGTSGNTPAGSPVVASKGFRLELQQMLEGWLGVIPSSSALSTSVGTLTQASVTEQLQAYLAAYKALDSDATALKQTRVQVKAQLPQARKYFAALKAALRSFLGEESPQLAQFGLKPGQARKPLSTKKTAVKVAKSIATRALRGTTGPVKRLETKSGPMQFVDPVATSGAASTAPADASASSTSSPPVAK